MCFGRVVLWPRGEVGGSSNASRGGVGQDVGVSESRRRSASASGGEFFVGLGSRVWLLDAKGLAFLASFGFLGDADRLAASGFFKTLLCSLECLKLDQKGCESDGGLCAGTPR